MKKYIFLLAWTSAVIGYRGYSSDASAAPNELPPVSAQPAYSREAFADPHGRFTRMPPPEIPLAYSVLLANIEYQIRAERRRAEFLMVAAIMEDHLPHGHRTELRRIAAEAHANALQLTAIQAETLKSAYATVIQLDESQRSVLVARSLAAPKLAEAATIPTPAVAHMFHLIQLGQLHAQQQGGEMRIEEPNGTMWIVFNDDRPAQQWFPKPVGTH